MEQPMTTLDPIKTKHRAMWAMGDYDRVSTEVVGDLGGIVVEAAGIQPGGRVLAVAAGSGNASLQAALAGGRVIARCGATRAMCGRDEPDRIAELDRTLADLANAYGAADGAIDMEYLLVVARAAQAAVAN